MQANVWGAMPGDAGQFVALCGGALLAVGLILWGVASVVRAFRIWTGRED